MIDVTVEEEHGWKYWNWKTPFKKKSELSNWWKNLDYKLITEAVFTVGEDRAGMMRQIFGGEWEQLDSAPSNVNECYMHIHEESDSFLQITHPDKKFPEDRQIFHCDGKEAPEFEVLGHEVSVRRD